MEIGIDFQFHFFTFHDCLGFEISCFSSPHLRDQDSFVFSQPLQVRLVENLKG